MRRSRTVSQPALLQFTAWYLAYTMPLTLLTIVMVAWRYNASLRPGVDVAPLALADAIALVLLAALPSTAFSYRAQRRFAETVLATQSRATFRLVRFALVFYVLNADVAFVLSVMLFLPLLYTIYVYVGLPIMFWFFPTHLLLGFLVGARVRSLLPEHAPLPW